MNPLPGSTILARGLLALHRARATGVVTVRGSGGVARLLVIEGTPRAIQIPGDDESLGELLSKDGSLDLAAHGDALATDEPRGLIGRWLVRHGAASEAAVGEALRAQLRRRTLRLFQWRELELAFRPSAEWEGGPPLEESLLPTELVLEALLETSECVTTDELRRRLGSGRIVLTRIGESLLCEAPLRACHARLLHRLRQGATVDELLDASGVEGAAVSFLWALKILGAIAKPTAHARSYQALIRKQRQLRGQVGDTRLLDLPLRANRTESRRALQKIARDLHPDRFPEPELQRVSNEVLGRLVEAKLHLDGRPGR